MCDHAAYSELKDDVAELKTRVSVIESGQQSALVEMREGFKEMKSDLALVYKDRREWSAWLREKIPNAAKWCGKAVAWLTAAAIGFNHLPDIQNFFQGLF